MRCKYDHGILCSWGRKCYKECPFLPEDLTKLESYSKRQKKRLGKEWRDLIRKGEDKEKCRIIGNMER